MWSYYGAKTNIVDAYPKPQYGKIIEPFAGTARYALKYFDREVLLVDKYEVIVKIWKWLQLCSEGDILGLPRHMKPGQKLDSFTFDCEEARLLMGFLIGKGGQAPRNKITNRIAIDRPNFTNFSLQRIAANLFKVRHWKITHGSFCDIPNQAATWFIDPPYQFGGQVYIESNRKIDFGKLAEWSMERQGQAIVCETTKADWLPFQPMKSQRGSLKMQNEAIWSNLPTAFSNTQQQLF